MNKALFIGICATAMLLAGCQNTINTIENADKSMTPNVVSDRRFVTDTFLRDRLALTGLTTNETPEGFLQVQLSVKNVRTGTGDKLLGSLQGENPYNVRYKFSWFAQNGMEIRSVLSDWQNLRIIPGETMHLQSVAPTKECKDFVVSLVEAK